MNGFVPKAETRRAALKEAVAYLRSFPLDTPVLDARLIVQHVLGIDWNTLFLAPDQPLSDTERSALAGALARRSAREPVARIVGRRHFWTLDLTVSPATLDPRPDTESLVEAALAAIPERSRPLRILDLGTGTGALLLALLAEFPRAWGIGVDQSAKAAATAQANAVSHGFGDRASMVVGDWADALASRFDLILSNPPYIARQDLAGLPAEVRDYDPIEALDGGPDGLDAYRRILPRLPPLLEDDGLAILEIGAGQGDAVAAVAEAGGLRQIARRPDLAGIERALVLQPSRAYESRPCENSLNSLDKGLMCRRGVHREPPTVRGQDDP
jgi:release factor glutamine methyltransferase